MNSRQHRAVVQAKRNPPALTDAERSAIDAVCDLHSRLSRLDARSGGSMNNEQYTAAEFIRGVTWAPNMATRVLIGGVPYVVGDLIADMADKSGYEFRDEIFDTLARVARGGDVVAQSVIRRMAVAFAEITCPPEPEPDDIPEPVTVNRYDQPSIPSFLTEAI